jgi:hypothetical protein
MWGSFKWGTLFWHNTLQNEIRIDLQCSHVLLERKALALAGEAYSFASVWRLVETPLEFLSNPVEFQALCVILLPGTPHVVSPNQLANGGPVEEIV